MKKIALQDRTKKLTAYSAMAAFVIAGKSLSAEIIYMDIEDESVDIGDFFNMDLDGDAIYDFHFRANSIVSSTSSGIWSFASVFGYATSSSVGDMSNMIIGYNGTFYHYGSVLNSGDIIGPKSPWLNYPSYGNSAVLASNYYGATYGAFPGQGEKFLGIRFVNADGLHYGWIRLTADVNPAHIIINDYAYENTPDIEITAGETFTSISQSPEIQASVYCYDKIIHIANNQDHDAVQIYSIAGELIFSDQLKEGNTDINLSAFPAGNYIVDLTGKQGKFSQQVYVN